MLPGHRLDDDGRDGVAVLVEQAFDAGDIVVTRDTSVSCA